MTGVAGNARRPVSLAAVAEYMSGAVAAVLSCVITLQGSSGTAGIFMMGAGLASLFVWIVWQDIKSLTISDTAILSVAVLAVSFRCAQDTAAGFAPGETAWMLLPDVLLPSAFMFLLREYYFRTKGRDALGFGDVKLSLAGGLLVGATGFFWALFAASLATLAYAGCRMVRGRPLMAADKIAFGAALAPAMFLVWAMEQWLLLTPPGRA
jgi:prepilin signal peptidase PulO-like enzyme (type II secretory pathway)